MLVHWQFGTQQAKEARTCGVFAPRFIAKYGAPRDQKMAKKSNCATHAKAQLPK
jgi:hypothetical protein